MKFKNIEKEVIYVYFRASDWYRQRLFFDTGCDTKEEREYMAQIIIFRDYTSRELSKEIAKYRITAYHSFARCDTETLEITQEMIDWLPRLFREKYHFEYDIGTDGFSVDIPEEFTYNFTDCLRTDILYLLKCDKKI